MNQVKKGGDLESFGTHLEIKMWIDYEGDDKQQVIMGTSTL